MHRGLAPLISPVSPQEFMSAQWPKQPFVTHELKIKTLTELPFLQSLDALLKSWPHQVQVHLPDLADEASSVDASPADARKLFANKMPLLFNNVQNISPELKNWLAALQADLGLPAMTVGRCMIYATPHGKGTAPHFDQNVNFVLQIHGTKHWWLAPNSNVENPTQRFTMGCAVDPELAAYVDSAMPEKMPDNEVEFVLKPGSMLFVPRGYWHRTKADTNADAALALNFTFSQPTWVDLLTTALRSRLEQSAEWRELADGVSSQNPKLKAVAENKFNLLLADLVSDLPNWQAQDILGATEGAKHFLVAAVQQ